MAKKKIKIIQVKKISDLERGMIVRHVVTGDSYVIDGNFGKYAIGVASVDISNPAEWEIVKIK